MNKYTIMCTAEQTKKALELGAPIKVYKPVVIESKDGGSFTTPTMETVTAEQMIGFLRSKGVRFQFDDEIKHWCVSIDNDPLGVTCGVGKNKELAAIDAALDYLMKNKGGNND